MKQSEFSKRFERFLRSLRFEDKVFLIFDGDVDGIVSCLITKIAFDKLGIKFSKITDGRFEKIKFSNLTNFDAGVVVDVPTGIQKKFLKTTKKKMLVIDHHPSEDMNSKNISYINPRLMKKEIYQPTSYVSYKLFSDFVDLKKIKWLAVVGTVGDYGFDDVKDIYKNEINVGRKEDIWKTNYGRAATRINAAIAVFGSEKAFGILKSCRSLGDIFRNKKFREAHKKFSKEFWSAERSMKKNSEFYADINLFFSIIEPKYSRITSALATKTGTTNPNSFVVLAERTGKKYNIHGRMQNGTIDVGGVLKNFGGGGHREAGGCTIDAKEMPFFKRRLIEILRGNK